MVRFEQEINGFRWVDFEAPANDDLKRISEEFGWPFSVLTACLDPENLPKYEVHPEGILVILRVYEAGSKPSAGTMQELSTKITVMISGNTLITLHRTPISFIQKKKETGKPLTQTTKEFFSFVVSETLLSYDGPLNDLESKTEVLEARIYNLERDRILRNGYLLKRRASAFKKIFRFTSELLKRCHSENELVWNEFQQVRDLMDRFLFYTDDVVENLTGLLNLHIALLSQKTNEASYRTNEVMRVLTVFSIVFLPLNFIAGIYGMNFEDMPELHSPHGYHITLAAMAAVAIIIFIFLLRRGWLRQPEND